MRVMLGFTDQEVLALAGEPADSIKSRLKSQHGFGRVHRGATARALRKHYQDPSNCTANLEVKSQLVGVWVSQERTAVARYVFYPDFRYTYHLVYTKGEVVGDPLTIGVTVNRQVVEDSESGIFMPWAKGAKGLAELYEDGTFNVGRVWLKNGCLKDVGARQYQRVSTVPPELA